VNIIIFDGCGGGGGGTFILKLAFAGAFDVVNIRLFFLS
jgi:hypothetical protein